MGLTNKAFSIKIHGNVICMDEEKNSMYTDPAQREFTG